MLKVFKSIVLLLAFVGVFAIAFVGFQFYQKIREGGEERAYAEAKEESATDSDSSDSDAKSASTTRSHGDSSLSSIVNDYKRNAELAKTGGSAAVGGASAPAALKPVPTPNPAVKLIRENRTGRKWIALTFDDGPRPDFTPQFIQLLQSKNVKATFFLIGPQVKSNPELAKQLVDLGFEIGNHTWTHAYLSKLAAEKVQDELVKTNQAIKDATGLDMNIMRPPYGAANPKVQKVCEDLGLKIVTWNIDTNDWGPKSTQESMISEIMTHAHDGSIILMHDRYDKSLKTTEYVIDKLREQGYEFVTVSELLGFKQVGGAPATSLAAATTSGTASNANGSEEPTSASAIVATNEPTSGTGAIQITPAQTLPQPGTGAAAAARLPPVSPEKLTKAPPAPAATPAERKPKRAQPTETPKKVTKDKGKEKAKPTETPKKRASRS